MPALIPRSPLSPECVACCRQFARLGLASPNVGQMQVRGKKKNPKARTQINVKLVQDLAGYGRKGAIVPVPIGRMRNVYFPQRIADYVSMAQAKDLKRNNVTIERDFNFGKDTSREGGEATDSGTTPSSRSSKSLDAMRIDLDLLQPADAFTVLSATVPPFVNFYRAPIALPDTSKLENVSGDTPSATNIYGSVSTADIVINLRALLANSVVAGRIVLAEDDIQFEDAGDGGGSTDRVKQLGTFNIQIRIKGHAEAVRRQVRVLPEDAESVDEEMKAAPKNDLAGDRESEALTFEAQVAELEATIEGASRPETAPITGEAATIGANTASATPPGGKT